MHHPLLYAWGHGVTTTLCSVLDGVLLEGAQVSKALPTPHALKLGFPGVDAAVLSQVLALLEALVAGGALKGLFPGVDPPVARHLRGVLEALLAVGALERLLARRVTVVLHELGGGHEAAVAQRALQRLLRAVRVVLVALERRRLLVALAAHVTLVGLLCRRGGRTALVLQELARLTEALLTGGTLEQTLDAVHVLMVEQVGGLEEALVTEVALERSVCGVLVRAAVAHQRVLLLEAHLALLALEGPFLGVGALVLAQVGLPLEALVAGAAAEGALAGWLALVVQQL